MLNFKTKNMNQLHHGETKKLSGEIQSDANVNKYTYSYKIKIKGNSFILYLKTKKGAKEFEYGDVITFNGKFELPEETRNYGGFSQKNYYKSKGIHGILYAEDAKLVRKTFSIGKLGSIIRIAIKEKIKQNVSENNANLLLGILIGDKDNIEDETIEDFTKSSLIHILCVSRCSCRIYYIMDTKSFKHIPAEK